MGNRNVLIVLAVIFVLVVAWNVLYFTGVVGDFNSPTSAGVAGDTRDSQFNVPNFRGNVGQQPVPAGAPAPVANQAPAVVRQRNTVTAADLSIDSNWGRNPFLTPQEIWAVENYKVTPVAARNPIPAGDLWLSAVLGDSAGRRMAVINDEVVGIGDVISGMEVIDVWDDAVVFRLGTDRHVLRMNDAAVRLTVRGDGAGRQ